MHFKVFSRSPITAAVILGLLAAQTQVLAQAQPSVPNSSKALQQNPLQQRYTFDLPEQHLLYSLGEFTATTQIAVVRQDGQPINGTAPALRGEMTADEALRTLLADSSLTFSYRNGRTAELLEPTTSITVGNQTAFSTLTVSADRIGDDWVYHEPRSVSVITREQIDRTPPRHAADMLQETPGVYSAVNAQDPGLSVNIRGMQDFGRVNMMVDGMRQNFNDNGHQQRNGTMYVDSELLSDVVVEKGSSTGVHGAGAIAGSANFRTIDVDDVLLPGKDIGVRLRGMTGVGGEGNGVNFIGSAAVAGRLGDRWELLAARSNRNFGEYAPGRRRPNYDFLTVGVQDEFHKDIVQDVDRVRFTDNEQDSNLFKARLHIDDDQSLTFSYLGTELSYNNVSDRQIMRAGEVVDGDDAWRRFGDASTTSDSVSLRYNLNPSSPLINLEANAYFVSTEGQRYTEAGRPVVLNGTDMTELNWMMGVCEQNPIPDNAYSACRAGLDNNNRTQIDTYGFTLENTAHFALGGIDGFSSNHGVEYFIDKGESTSAQERGGRQLASIDNTMQPSGERSIASAFSNLQWENEAFTLAAGLRYDYYKLKGSTKLPGVEWTYHNRYDRASRRAENGLRTRRSNCISAIIPEQSRQTACDDIPTWEGYVNDPTSMIDYETSWRYEPTWLSDTVMQDYDVDNSMDKLLPTLSAAYRPNENVELFANWGRGWRPPSLTETLMQGSHPGDPFAVLFPNPHAQPETSRSWDIGTNFTAQDLFKSGDRFFSKLSYYDTRVDNYLITSMVNVMPGQQGGLGHTMFVPNLLPMNFRGLELEIDYDAERWYTQANYTHVLGSDNQFCQKIYPLGSGNIREDIPDENGNYSDAYYEAIEAGYDSYEAMRDDLTYCGIDVIGMNSARQLPMDRGSLTFGTRWFDQRLDVGTRLNYSAAGGPEDFDFDLWPSYVTWDLYASYQVNPNLLLRATMLNVRDRNYVTGYSDIFSKSYGAGRTLMAGAELRF
ncbi:TonB-dependent hemoglobin/transferrin/lactoferrin family receptor [Halomonas sp. AOP43-D1-4]|uniref:TonB-dependent hemoglobin/transferrin/lactoferrin family receptor n=1 Tax=Halomonas sp. AOP43-D1-4 TaxID=3457658 RepID=UPI0040341109